MPPCHLISPFSFFLCQKSNPERRHWWWRLPNAHVVNFSQSQRLSDCVSWRKVVHPSSRTCPPAQQQSSPLHCSALHRVREHCLHGVENNKNKKKEQGGRKHTHTRTKMKVSLLCFSEHVPRTEKAPLSRYREQQRQQQMVPTPPLLLTRGVRQEKKKDGKKRRPAKRRCVRVSFVPASRPRIYTPFQGRLGNAGKGAQKCAVVASRSGD